MRTIQKIIVLSALLFLQCASEDEPMDVDDAITNPAPNTPVNGGSNTNSNSTSQEFDRS